MAIHPAARIRLDIAASSDPAAPEWLGFPALTVRALRLSAERVESEDLDAGEWRAALALGVKSARIEAEGLIAESPAEAALMESFMTGAPRLWRLALPSALGQEGAPGQEGGALSGLFLVERLEFSARGDGEAGFAFALISTGPLTHSQT